MKIIFCALVLFYLYSMTARKDSAIRMQASPMTLKVIQEVNSNSTLNKLRLENIQKEQILQEAINTHESSKSTNK